MEWIISDTHFGHKNIITYCSRPCADVKQMDDAMIKRWCGAVKSGDTVYHLGDVGYLEGSQAVKTPDSHINTIIHRLPGLKVLTLGNHDRGPAPMHAVGFDVVCDEIILRRFGRVLRLRHKPTTLQGTCDWVLHGHIHNSTPETRREHEHKGELVNIPDFCINMSVELWNYTPVSLPWLVKRLVYWQKMREKGIKEPLNPGKPLDK